MKDAEKEKKSAKIILDLKAEADVIMKIIKEHRADTDKKRGER